jgi:hypothetical protein
MNTGPITTEEKRHIVEQVLESKRFQRAPKLSDFFRHVCEKTLESGDASIREQDIGRSVYQRAEDYSPSADNIVRVEARNLRKKLDEFFIDEGKDLPIVVRIPRGAYVPQFERRNTDAAEPVEALTLQQRSSRPVLLLGSLAVLLALSTGWLWLKNNALEARLGSASAAASPGPLWSLLFDDQHNTQLVLADSGFVVIQNLLKRRLTLADYLNRDYGVTAADRAAQLIAESQFTSVTGAQFAGGISQVPGINRKRLTIRSARDVQSRDFKGNNVILMGSIRSNPWVELFEPKLNFRFEFDFALSRAAVRNVSPRPGESAIYEAGGRDGKSNEIYSTVALVPNLTKDGYVLLLSGTRTEGTESASELLLNSDLTAKMIDSLQLRKAGRLHYFEILLKSARMGGTSKGAEIIAHRILAD